MTLPLPPKPEPEIHINFAFEEPQTRLFQQVKRGTGTYLHLVAPQCLEVGGQRSGKTVGKLMYGILNYCLKFNRCDILVLRRTIPELDAGVIQDMKTFIPAELYDFNHSTRIATFRENGSRVVFAGCANNVERDIERYLGQAYPYILVDECSQFSPDVWYRLYARNLVNASCQEDKHGNLPIPFIIGCTNPIGEHFPFYHTLFVEKEPIDKVEGARHAKDGSWWAKDAGEWHCIYKPTDYAYNHTTVLTNKAYRKRDPGIIDRLRSLPKAKMEKFLLGYMGGSDTQYFDCFSPEYHVVDLREDPDAIIWQDWQPVWGGQDWGVAHWNAFYLFTKALVRRTVGDEYVTKTVCFREVAPDTTGHTNIDFADMIAASVNYPRLPQDNAQYERISGKRCHVSTIYFSHEKFSRVMSEHSPADEYSKLLRKRGLPPVSRGTMDRIASAAYMYNTLKAGKLVILRTCPGIIQAIPQLPRDPKELDDVLKTSTKADDRYDAFRLGLYGEFKSRTTPDEESAQEFAKSLSPMARHFYLQKKRYELDHAKDTITQKEKPYWQVRP